MKNESMERYPGSLRVTKPPMDENLAQIQGQISTLTEKIQELTIPRLGRPQIWCTICYIEGHLENECPCMRGMGPLQNSMGPSLGPMGGVVKVSVNLLFHTPTPYHAFPGNQAKPSVEYCEIFQIHGHGPGQCPIIQKYSMVPNTVHCEFCASTTLATNHCRELDALADRLDRITFKVNETPQGLGRGRGGGAGGDFIGGRTGGRGPGICYNCDE